MGPILSEKGSAGGRQIVDTFTIYSTAVVDTLLAFFNDGPRSTGALTLQARSGAAVMLLPPVDFRFHAVREDGGVARPRLSVAGDFGRLVPELAISGADLPATWDFAGGPDPAARHTYKVAIATAMRELRDTKQCDGVSDEVYAWLAPLVG